MFQYDYRVTLAKYLCFIYTWVKIYLTALRTRRNTEHRCDMKHYTMRRNMTFERASSDKTLVLVKMTPCTGPLKAPSAIRFCGTRVWIRFVKRRVETRLQTELCVWKIKHNTELCGTRSRNIRRHPKQADETIQLHVLTVRIVLVRRLWSETLAGAESRDAKDWTVSITAQCRCIWRRTVSWHELWSVMDEAVFYSTRKVKNKQNRTNFVHWTAKCDCPMCVAVGVKSSRSVYIRFILVERKKFGEMYLDRL
jgi:hypothetical protein